MEIMKEKKKTISIFRLFLKHLIALSVAILVLLITVAIGGNFAMQLGIILRANYAEQILNQEEDTLSNHFDEELLPLYSKYMIINETEILETNMSAKEIEKVQAYLIKGTKAYYEFYKIIQQENENVLIVQYDMLVHFRNPIMNKILPYPELILVLLVLFLILLFFVITALRFSKRLKINLVPIVTATEKIKAKDLDFEIEPTKIAEFNDSLEAIDELKKALLKSLNQQWNDEQKRKSQLSALAHDIKTPLTIIRGNAELLLEEESLGENKEQVVFIQESSNTIERYLEILMNVVNHESMEAYRKQVKIKAFMDNLMKDALALCRIKNIQLNLQQDTKCDVLYIDEELLERAIINIIDNAVRYSRENDHIVLCVTENETHIRFEIEDFGKGFSEEALKKATEEFYTQDSSRTNHNYGLGLSFAKRVAKVHEGTLEFENKKTTTGARVGITIRRV